MRRSRCKVLKFFSQSACNSILFCFTLKTWQIRNYLMDRWTYTTPNVLWVCFRDKTFLFNFNILEFIEQFHGFTSSENFTAFSFLWLYLELNELFSFFHFLIFPLLCFHNFQIFFFLLFFLQNFNFLQIFLFFLNYLINIGF